MILANLINFLEEHAPLQFQESYDNSGLIVGDINAEIKSVLVALDAVESVVDEAIKIGANVIVAHHPIIFSGLKKITGANYIERTILKAIKNDIAIYAIHTNLDNIYYGGVNEMIGKKLSLINTQTLLPKPNHQLENNAIGSGLVGYLEAPIAELDFLAKLKSDMRVSIIKHTRLLDKPIHKIALCGGSGRFLLEEAIRVNADVYISSDFKYHEYFDANNNIVIADIGHFESEQFTIELLVELINKKFSNFAAHFAKTNTNPVNYY